MERPKGVSILILPIQLYRFSLVLIKSEKGDDVKEEKDQKEEDEEREEGWERRKQRRRKQ